MTKRLYTGFSFFEFINMLFLRLACVFGLIFTLPHYDENPVLIIIVSAICLLLMFFLGDDQIIVYEDRVTQITNSFSSLIFKSKGKTIKMNEIKYAHLQSLPKSSPSEIGVAILLAAVLPKGNIDRDKARPIFFELKNGDTLKFDTNLESNKMKKIVEIVNSLTQQTASNN